MRCAELPVNHMCHVHEHASPLGLLLGQTTAAAPGWVARRNARLGVQHAYVLGLSMGGIMAIDFTLAYPDMIDDLIPVDSGLSGYHDSGSWTQEFDAIFALGKEAGAQAAKTQWLKCSLFAAARDLDQSVANCEKDSPTIGALLMAGERIQASQHRGPALQRPDLSFYG